MSGNPFRALEEQGIAPVISLRDAGKAVPLAKALAEGGVTNIEITLRTDAALDAISRIKSTLPWMTVSAGTVLTTKNVDNAVSAGADYVVTPGYADEIVAYCTEHGVSVVPGCVTASEVDRGIRAGLKYLKFFPAESLGGLKAIDLLCGPYRGIRFLPTGGMTYDNIGSYLASKNILACGGSFMAPSALIERGDWAAVTANVRRAMDLSLGFAFARVGLVSGSREEAEKACRRLALLFRLPCRPGKDEDLCGNAVAFPKEPAASAKGQLVFRTNSAERAAAYFRNAGVPVGEEGCRRDASGRLQAFCLDETVVGYAVCVTQ